MRECKMMICNTSQDYDSQESILAMMHAFQDRTDAMSHAFGHVVLQYCMMYALVSFQTLKSESETETMTDRDR